MAENKWLVYFVVILVVLTLNKLIFPLLGDRIGGFLAIITTIGSTVYLFDLTVRNDRNKK